MKVWTACAVLLLTGCANPWATYYRGTQDARTIPNYVASADAPRLIAINGANLESEKRGALRAGYVDIGGSSFSAGSNAASEDHLREQASRVGAHLVLYESRYSHTVNSAVPLTTPNTTTSYTSGGGTIYGSRGPVPYSANATTTTYGTTTTMMPVNVDRSNFGAMFFARIRWRVGVYTLPLDDETRRRIGSNSGLLIDVVVDNSPAFVADVLPGDILVAVNGAPIAGRDLRYFLDQVPPNGTAEFTILRGESRLTKRVTMAF